MKEITSPVGVTSWVNDLPITLFAHARRERLPMALICRTFDVGYQEVMTGSILLRDLLVSRAREQGLVDPNWSTRATTISGALNEIGAAICANWTKLLSPREYEEHQHVIRIITFLKSTNRREYHVQNDHCA